MFLPTKRYDPSQQTEASEEVQPELKRRKLRSEPNHNEIIPQQSRSKSKSDSKSDIVSESRTESRSYSQSDLSRSASHSDSRSYSHVDPDEIEHTESNATSKSKSNSRSKSKTDSNLDSNSKSKSKSHSKSRSKSNSKSNSKPTKSELKSSSDHNSSSDSDSDSGSNSESENNSNNTKVPHDEIVVDPKYASVLDRFRSMAAKVAIDKVDPKTAAKLYDQEKKSEKHYVETAKEQKNEKEDLTEVDEDGDEEPIEVNELVPLPQIEKIKDADYSKQKKYAPKWTSKPTYIPINTSKPFSEFLDEGLFSSRMFKVLEDSLEFKSAFAVQTGVIPVLLKDNQSISPDPLPDVLVNAYTGSGKTLAYGIPIIEALSTRVVPRIRALILLPTKPLIQQVRSVLETLAKGTSLRIMICRTERPFKEEQRLLITETPDILISTPGRLVDHIRNSTNNNANHGFTLKHLKYLVVDEADRLLNQSFQEWVPVLVEALDSVKPKQPTSSLWFRPPQKLVFSATLTRDPGKLAALNITTNPNPRIFVLGDEANERESINQITEDIIHEDRKKMMIDYEFSLPEQLKENLIFIKSAANKPLVLLQLLANHDLKADTIIFVKSNQAAARLARLITLIDQELFHLNLVVERCSGELELSQRRKMLKNFAHGEIGILVCTDLIARGIDISTVKAVINYDLPVGKREYIHRVGRTARAGNSGTAWNLTVGSGERKFFWSIANSIYRKGDVDTEVIQTRIDDNDGYQRALTQLEEEVFAK